MKTLDELRDMEIPDILERFGPVEELRETKRKNIIFRGMPAISFSLSYRQADEDWRSETILAVSSDEKAVWRLEMRCRAHEYRKFEASFEHMIASFKLQCPQRRN